MTGRGARAAGVAAEQPLELRLQHLVLLLGVALIALVARTPAEHRLQLSALYGTAALAKLNESYLGGDVLAARWLVRRWAPGCCRCRRRRSSSPPGCCSSSSSWRSR